MDLVNTASLGPTSLDNIRAELVRMEDSIIFALIERAQFAQNTNIYQKGFFEGLDSSFMEFLLHEIECAHAKGRRYTSPDEYPFTSPLPPPVLPALSFPPLLHRNTINLNDQIMDIYITKIVPQLCPKGDDANHGSAAAKDVDALQLLSRRIHYGKFVAEAKFNDPEHHDLYVELIKAQDGDKIMDLLTNHTVERRLLRRLRRKALIYGQEVDEDDDELPTPTHTTPNNHTHNHNHTHPSTTTTPTTHQKPDPSTKTPRLSRDVVADMYERFVIPLTKQVEVDYLLTRLG
ncbi:chorismate mutase [Fimicolochytrium jonesii]|uniref:chorismate mutase n=1 Tax=Fimicolochytrium jonesii TaxID=1396493 RepID=UPI0022FF3623|nr:chorismate mutase [Fimicolochytrium jonesii]KAI8820161.1 chorismate mutase [Fimicolochytrium jonesii]